VRGGRAARHELATPRLLHLSLHATRGANSFGAPGGGVFSRMPPSPPPGTPSGLAGQRRMPCRDLRPSKPVAFRPPPSRGRESPRAWTVIGSAMVLIATLHLRARPD